MVEAGGVKIEFVLISCQAHCLNSHINPFSLYIEEVVQVTSLTQKRGLRVEGLIHYLVPLKAKMKKSPIYPKYETTAYEGDGFDSHVVDFSQFLQEARHHAREVGFHSSSLHPEENVKKRLAEEKKVKKSWKNSLLSWWKTDKKSKLQVEPEVSSYNSTPRQRLVSGPIHGSGKNNDCSLTNPMMFRPMDLFTW
nr:hypothetical protein CFP56_49994 [Quercus suber]